MRHTIQKNRFREEGKLHWDIWLSSWVPASINGSLCPFPRCSSDFCPSTLFSHSFPKALLCSHIYSSDPLLESGLHLHLSASYTHLHFPSSLHGNGRWLKLSTTNITFSHCQSLPARQASLFLWSVSLSLSLSYITEEEAHSLFDICHTSH